MNTKAVFALTCALVLVGCGSESAYVNLEEGSDSSTVVQDEPSPLPTYSPQHVYGDGFLLIDVSYDLPGRVETVSINMWPQGAGYASSQAINFPAEFSGYFAVNMQALEGPPPKISDLARAKFECLGADRRPFSKITSLVDPRVDQFAGRPSYGFLVAVPYAVREACGTRLIMLRIELERPGEEVSHPMTIYLRNPKPESR